MSNPAASGYASNATRTQAEMETFMELLVSLGKETLGGSQKGVSIPMVSNAFTVSDNVMSYQIDTTALAATGTLNKINTTAGTRDGMVIMIQPTNNARVITVANAAGGSGQILTKDGLSKVFRDTRQCMLLQWDAGATSWRVIFDDETFRINQLLGGQNFTTLTNTGTAGNITPLYAFHYVDTSGPATQTVANALTTTIADLGRVITLAPFNAPTRSPILMHMAGGAGQFQMIDGNQYKMNQAASSITFQLRSVAAVLTWVEIGRESDPVPSATVAGQIPIGNGAGGYSLLTPPTSSNGGTLIIDTSANGSNGLAFTGPMYCPPGGRLYGTSGKPYEQYQNATTLYYGPAISNVIQLFDTTSGAWLNRTFAETSLSTAGLANATGYYVYGYWNTNIFALEAVSWAGARPTYLNGRLCKTGAPDRLFLGSIYTDSSGSKFLFNGGVSSTNRNVLTVRNVYNSRLLRYSKSTGTSWTYSSATPRLLNGDSACCITTIAPPVASNWYADGIVTGTIAWKTTTANFSPNITFSYANATALYPNNRFYETISASAPLPAATTTTNTTIRSSIFDLAYIAATNPVDDYLANIYVNEASDGTHVFTFYGNDATTGGTGGIEAWIWD